jgi:hypothetical protein
MKHKLLFFVVTNFKLVFAEKQHECFTLPQTILRFIKPYQKCHQMCSRMKFVYKTQVLTFLSRNLHGGYPWDVKFQNFELHQVCPKDYECQNFIFLACKGEAVWYKFLWIAATAREWRKKIIVQIMSKNVLKRDFQQYLFLIFPVTKPILPSYSICGK